MRKHLREIFLGILLFFCCILLYDEAHAQTVIKKEEVYISPNMEKKNTEYMECKKSDKVFWDDWRYIRIYLNKKLYITIDLAVVAGVSALAFFVAFRRE